MRNLLFFGFLILALQFFQCKSADVQEQERVEVSLDSLWQKYDLHTSKQRPESAMNVLDSIIIIANRQNEDPHKIKAIYSKYQQINRKEGSTNGIEYLEKQLENTGEVSAAILHYITALGYLQYYNSNRWEIDSRTSYASTGEESVEEWGHRQFLEAIYGHLFSAVDTQLQTEPTQKWEIVLEELDSSMVKYRPVLYDVIIPEVAEILGRSEMQMLPLAELKWLKDPALLADKAGFYELEVNDTLNYLDESILFFQNWLLWRENNNTTALAHADLSRLNFFHAHLRHPDKEDLYLSALENFENTYSDIYAVAQSIYIKAQLYARKGAANIEENVNGWQMAVRTARELQNKFPNTPYAKNAQNIIAQIEQSSLQIEAEKVNLPEQPFLINLRSRNLDKLTVSAHKIAYDDLNDLRRTGSKEMLQYISQFPKIAEKEYTLPTVDNYTHRNYEVAFPPLETGVYVLLVKAGESVHWQNMEVSDLAGLTIGGNQLLVVDRRTGNPINGAKVTIEERDWRKSSTQTETFTTDEEGKVFINVGNRNNHVVKKIEKDQRVHYPELNIYKTSPPGELSNRTVIHLLTDRSLYRPGQTVYFKGIIYNRKTRSNWEVRKNEEVEIQLKDQNGQTIGKRELTSNAWGSIEGYFHIPEEVLTGDMMITTPFGHTNIKVEEYKRPTFSVELEVNKGQKYTLGDSLQINGVAKTLNDVPLDQAEVSYTVRRKYYRPWYLYYLPPVRSQEVEIAAGIIPTDENGEFEIRFQADTDTAVDHASFTIITEVTDIGGETQTAEKDLSLSRKPFQVVADLAELMTKENFENLTFKAVNNFGDTIQEQVRVDIISMTGPEAGKIERYWSFPDSILMSEEVFRAQFENYAFKDLSSPEKWSETGEMTSEELILSEPVKLPSTILNEAQKGWYRLVFSDMNGEEVNTYYFELIPKEGPRVSAKPQLTVLNGIPSIEAGESAELNYILPVEDKKIYTALYYPSNKTKYSWNDGRNIVVSPGNADRGEVGVLSVAVSHNRIYIEETNIRVPWTNKELDIKVKTFREILKPGVEEKWSFTVSDPEAELAAVLYDASLDEIYDHDWSGIQYPNYRNYIRISYNSFHAIHLRMIKGFDRDYAKVELPKYPSFIFSLYGYPHFRGGPDYMQDAVRVEARDGEQPEGMEVILPQTKVPPPEEESTAFATSEETQTDQQAIRENLQETVFFQPRVQSENGEFTIEFTVGEALTAWNLFLFAHTKDVKTGVKELQVKTRKELMIRPQLPRFFRSGDTIDVVGRIQNQSTEKQDINARIVLKNALTGEEINSLFTVQQAAKSLEIDAGRSSAVDWQLIIPEADEVPAVRVEMYAETGQWSDGEANILPVVTDRIILTSARPMEVSANSNSSFNLENWSGDFLNSNTAQPLEYGLEFTKQPLWYALRALPYLSASEYECSEQLVNRLYANGLASKIASEVPQLSEILDQWQREGSLKSPLQQDEKWKSVDINSTPWLKNALEETQQMQSIELLLDEQRMEYESRSILRKLGQWQNADGGFSWFKGGRSNLYMTQYIAVQLLRIQQLELITSPQMDQILKGAIDYCDKEFQKWYEKLNEDQQSHETNTYWSIQQAHYFYLKSLEGKIPETSSFVFLDSLLKSEWTETGLYNQAILARSWQLQGEEGIASELIRSFRERAIKDPVIGAYWNQVGVRRTYTDDIELHAMMIEVFEAAGDADFTNRLKTWLIKNKQTNHWTSTKSTAAAIHALLLQGKPGLEGNGEVNISADSEAIPWTTTSAVEEWHQSYEKQADEGSEYPFDKIEVENTREHPVWGAAYVRYSEKMDVVRSGTQFGLQIEKKYFKERWGVSGNKLIPLENADRLVPGDVLVARIIVSVDRSMDFVHLKSERPSSMEPVRQLSGYTFRDGIFYYESAKDQATHFFIDHLPKGTFVFEHRERVALKGSCLGGLSQIESMYAPEFRAHTSGKRIQTGEK